MRLFFLRKKTVIVILIFPIETVKVAFSIASTSLSSVRRASLDPGGANRLAALLG